MYACKWASLGLGFAQHLAEMSTRGRNIMFWGVERGRCLRLTTLEPTVSRLSGQCGILNISQPYRPPRPVTGIALLYLVYVCKRWAMIHPALALRPPGSIMLDIKM
jgi:hypothetical protein